MRDGHEILSFFRFYLDDFRMYQIIDFIRRDTDPHGSTGQVQDIARQRSGGPHLFDVLGRLHLDHPREHGLVDALRYPRLGVIGFPYVRVRHLLLRALLPRSDRPGVREAIQSQRRRTSAGRRRRRRLLPRGLGGRRIIPKSFRITPLATLPLVVI